MQMKEIQIGHTLCSPETLKSPLKNQVRQNAQPSTGCGIAKFRYFWYNIGNEGGGANAGYTRIYRIVDEAKSNAARASRFVE